MTTLLSLPGAEARTVVRGRALNAAGVLAHRQGDYEGARALGEESLALHRVLGDHRGIAHALSDLGSVARDQGEYEAARALFEESPAISRELGNQHGIAWSLGALGHVAREAGDYARCAAYYRESMALQQSREERFAIAQGLEDFAGLAGRQRQWERAVRLLGAAECLARTLWRCLPVAVPEEYQRTVDGARPAMGEAAFAAAWAEGRAMTLDQSVAFALEG